ncbi:interleukin-10 receptor subunit beta isoform X2 [Psammomys obesus]|uniref:interleukin-10 receptor subunit beta isoform X2 n=1 Tax=Psammomys obesus TaxID=48139 RepID=UPI002453355C|nr:interleukin-10 receptor subunit beta isoform X2 [Psammomys obesus]
MARARGSASWLAGFLLLPALGMLPPPENVRMNSVNFKNILQWDPPAFPEENLTFTAQYESYRYFQDRCKNTVSTQCDFSTLSKYGVYTLRVRTELADEHSDWVNITFCPVEDTTIGPPEVRIEFLADSLHMRFSAPHIENEPETWTMKNIYISWTYRAQYWKNGTNEKVQVTSPYDFEVVRGLEPWTTYCVQVQGFLQGQNRTGEWSKPVCERATSDAELPKPADLWRQPSCRLHREVTGPCGRYFWVTVPWVCPDGQRGAQVNRPFWKSSRNDSFLDGGRCPHNLRLCGRPLSPWLLWLAVVHLQEGQVHLPLWDVSSTAPEGVSGPLPSQHTSALLLPSH